MSNVNDFAEACNDMNSLKELTEALEGKADETDMSTWHITESQWREAIEAAIVAKEKDVSINEALKLIQGL